MHRQQPYDVGPPLPMALDLRRRQPAMGEDQLRPGAAPAPWYGGAAEFVAMWLAMMVPMMLPPLLPRLLRHGQTTLVVLGCFAVWALLGLAIHAAAVVVSELDVHWVGLQRVLPALSGATVVPAGVVQLGSWKARRLARCRDQSAAFRGREPSNLAARPQAGVNCTLSCGNLMLALLAIGMMNPVAVAAVDDSPSRPADIIPCLPAGRGLKMLA
jgi:predicted metal-binding membrane protein